MAINVNDILDKLKRVEDLSKNLREETTRLSSTVNDSAKANKEYGESIAKVTESIEELEAKEARRDAKRKKRQAEQEQWNAKRQAELDQNERQITTIKKLEGANKSMADQLASLSSKMNSFKSQTAQVTQGVGSGAVSSKAEITSLTNALKGFASTIKTAGNGSTNATTKIVNDAKKIKSGMESAFFGSQKARGKSSIASFFKEQFQGVSTAITKEVANVQASGFKLGEGVVAGISTGISSGAGNATIGKALAKQLGKIVDQQTQEAYKALSKIIKGWDNLLDSDKIEKISEVAGDIKEKLATIKDIKLIDTTSTFGTPDKKKSTMKEYDGRLKNIKNFNKEVVNLAGSLNTELTTKQKSSIKQIASLESRASKAMLKSVANGNPEQGMDKVKFFQKQAKEIQTSMKRSVSVMNMNVKAQKDATNTEIDQQKIKNTVWMNSLKNREDFYKKNIKVVESGETQLRQIQGKFTSKELAPGGLSKGKLGFTASGASEQELVKIMARMNSTMRKTASDQTISLTDMTKSFKSYTTNYEVYSMRLITMMNERQAREKASSIAFKEELKSRKNAVKNIGSPLSFLSETENIIKDNAKIAKQDFEKRLVNAKEYYSEYMKNEETFQENLRQLSGKWTEKELYSKKESTRAISGDISIEAEVKQLKKMQDLLNDAKTNAQKSQADIVSGGSGEMYAKQAIEAQKAYVIEKDVMEKLIYGRLNVKRKEDKIRKEQEVKDKESLAVKIADEIKANALEVRLMKETNAKVLQADRNAVISNKAKLDANLKAQQASSKALSKLGKSIGFGYRNRNLFESASQSAYAIRRFGHDMGMGLHAVIKKMMVLTAMFTAFAVAVSATAVVASKKFLDFGESIIKATESIRGYRIALYGMMQSQAGVNELIATATKVTADLPIGFQQVQESLKGLVLIAPVRDMLKNADDVEATMGRLYKIVIGLAQIQPEWGAKGAIFSLRNALTGDLRSLQRRFEIPVRAIYSDEGVSLQDLQYQPEKMVETLSKYISTFYNSETLSMQNAQFGAVLEKLKGVWVNFLSSIGESGFYDIFVKQFIDVRNVLQDFEKTSGFKTLAKSISNSMSTILISVKTVLSYIGGNIMKNVFGIDEKSNKADVVSKMFETTAKTIKALSAMIQDDSTRTYIKDTGTAMYESIINPIKEFARISYSMFKDVKAGIEYISNALQAMGKDSTFGDVAKKGLLWTMIIGPGNVAMIGASAGILFANVLGMFVNTVKVMIALMGFLKTTWLGVWLAPFAKIALAFGGVVALVKGLQFALINPEETKETIRDIADFLVITLGIAFSNIAKQMAKLALLIASKIPFLNSFLPKSEYAGNTGISYKQAEISRLEAGHRNINIPSDGDPYGMPRNLVNPNQKQIDRLRAEIEAIQNDKSQISDIDKVLNVSLMTEMYAGWSTNAIGKQLVIKGGYIEKGIGWVSSLVGGLSNLLTDTDKELEKLVVPITDTKTGKSVVADIKNLTDSTKNSAMPMFKAIQELNGIGVQITSAFRKGDSGTHGKGYSIDSQILSNGGVADGSTGLGYNAYKQSISKMVEHGGIKKIIMESANGQKMNETIAEKLNKEFKDTDISYKQIAGQKNPVMHTEFVQKGVDAIKTNLGEVTQNLYKNFTNTLNNTEIDVFSGINEVAGSEPGKQLIHALDGMHGATNKLSKGIKLRASSMVGMVTATFEQFKKDNGQMFGPSALKEMEASFNKYEESKRAILNKIDMKSELSNEGVKIAYEEFLKNMFMFGGEEYSEKDKFANFAIQKSKMKTASMGVGVSQYSDVNSVLPMMGMLGMMTASQNSARTSQSVVYDGADISKQNLLSLQLMENVSATLLQTQILKKEFEFLSVPADILASNWQTEFNDKALVESVRMAHILNADFTANKETMDRAFKNVQKLRLEGMGLDDAIDATKKNYVNDKDVDRVHEILESTRERFHYIQKEYGVLAKTRKLDAKKLTDLKKYNAVQLLANKSKYLGSKNKAVRTGYSQEFSGLVAEGEITDANVIVQSSIENAVAEWDNFGTIIETSTKETVNNMSSAFETGFFDIMTGKIKGLGEMFSSIGQSIIGSIAKIISKMLAMSATKMIFGIDMNGSSGGSAGGLLGGLFSMFTGGSSGGGFGSSAIGALSGLLDPGNSTTRGGGIGAMLANVVGASSGAGGGLLSGILTTGGTAGAGLMAGGAGAGILSSLIGSTVSSTLASKGVMAAINAGASHGAIAASALKFLANPATLIAGGVAAFITQPGRWLGGSVDKTQPARAAQASWNDQRSEMMNRRTIDTLDYYMGDTASIEGAQMGGIGLTTWKSGAKYGYDMWNGPSETHASADPSAYLASLEGYYKLLMLAGESHYENVKKLNKQGETNQFKSLQMQLAFDGKKMTIIQAEYARFASPKYTGADKRDKMDEWRDAELEAEYANWQLQEEVLKMEKETAYAKMNYETWVASMGQNQVAIATTAISIEKERMAKLDANSLEWYEAKMSLMQNEISLANTLKANANEAKNTLANIFLSLAKMGQTGMVSTGMGLARMPRLLNPNADGRYGVMAPVKKNVDLIKGLKDGNLDMSQVAHIVGAKKTGMGGSGIFDTHINRENVWERSQNWFGGASSSNIQKRIEQIQSSGGKNVVYNRGKIEWDTEVERLVQTWDMTIEDAITELTEDMNRYIGDYSLTLETTQIGESTRNLLNNIDSSIGDKFDILTQTYRNLEIGRASGFIDNNEFITAMKETDRDMASFVNGLAGNINQVIKSGYISLNDGYIANFNASVASGNTGDIENSFDAIIKAGNKGRTKEGMLDYFKGDDDFSNMNSVLAGDDMKDIREIMDLSQTEEKYNAFVGYKDVEYWQRKAGSGWGESWGESWELKTISYPQYEERTRLVDPINDLSNTYDSPWELYYETKKATIMNKLNSAEDESAEWFDAQSEFFALMTENMEHAKEKAEKLQDDLNGMFGKIEETMRMRIAEEKETAKGDVYYFDVGETRDSKVMLDKMLEAVKTNDPDAQKLIDAFRKKMMGIK